MTFTLKLGLTAVMNRLTRLYPLRMPRHEPIAFVSHE
jgi:hypothetical protein